MWNTAIERYAVCDVRWMDGWMRCACCRWNPVSSVLICQKQNHLCKTCYTLLMSTEFQTYSLWFFFLSTEIVYLWFHIKAFFMSLIQWANFLFFFIFSSLSIHARNSCTVILIQWNFLCFHSNQILMSMQSKVFILLIEF